MFPSIAMLFLIAIDGYGESILFVYHPSMIFTACSLSGLFFFCFSIYKSLFAKDVSLLMSVFWTGSDIDLSGVWIRMVGLFSNDFIEPMSSRRFSERVLGESEMMGIWEMSVINFLLSWLHSRDLRKSMPKAFDHGGMLHFGSEKLFGLVCVPLSLSILFDNICSSLIWWWNHINFF